jgi:hypothetical protein
LRRHGAVDDSNWKVELENRLLVLRDYYEEYYKHFRAQRFYLHIDEELNRLKGLVEGAYNARKRTRDHRKMKDDEKAQIEATNTYIKTMLDITEKILDLPQTWDHRQTLAQVMDQQALLDLKDVWGVDHGNDVRAYNHYHNFRVWLYNEGLNDPFHRRMLFPPQGGPPRVLHDDDTSDEDDEDDEDEDDGGEEGPNPCRAIVVRQECEHDEDEDDDDDDGVDADMGPAAGTVAVLRPSAQQIAENDAVGNQRVLERGGARAERRVDNQRRGSPAAGGLSMAQRSRRALEALRRGTSEGAPCPSANVSVVDHVFSRLGL